MEDVDSGGKNLKLSTKR